VEFVSVGSGVREWWRANGSVGTFFSRLIHVSQYVYILQTASISNARYRLHRHLIVYLVFRCLCSLCLLIRPNRARHLDRSHFCTLSHPAHIIDKAWNQSLQSASYSSSSVSLPESPQPPGHLRETRKKRNGIDFMTNGSGLIDESLKSDFVEIDRSITWASLER
jgi:hypothetical protein